MTKNDALNKAGLHFLPRQYRKAIEMLYDESMTCEQLAVKLDTSKEYTRLILGRLHKAKVACAVHWRREREVGVFTKVWGIGSKDEKQPPKLARHEISKRYRNRKRGASGEVRIGVWGL